MQRRNSENAGQKKLIIKTHNKNGATQKGLHHFYYRNYFLTTKFIERLAVSPFESFAVTVNLYVPAVSGV